MNDSLMIRENIRAELAKKVELKIVEIIDAAEKEGLCSCQRTLTMDITDPESGRYLAVKLRDSTKYNSRYMSVTNKETMQDADNRRREWRESSRPRYLISQYNTSSAQDLLAAVRILKTMVRTMSQAKTENDARMTRAGKELDSI